MLCDYVACFRFASVPGKVTNLSVTGKTNLSLSLEWGEPKERNGVIVNYTIRWWESEDNSTVNSMVLKTSDPQMNFNITNLTPYTNYSVEVFARTSVGPGDTDFIKSPTDTGCKHSS